jgi:hypothetical protein
MVPGWAIQDRAGLDREGLIRFNQLIRPWSYRPLYRWFFRVMRSRCNEPPTDTFDRSEAIAIGRVVADFLRQAVALASCTRREY